jgi:hypothetical protein
MAGFSVGDGVSDLDGAVERFSADVRIEDLDEAMVSFVVDENVGVEVGTRVVVRVGLPILAADGAEV